MTEQAVPISGESIKLGQFIKLANLTETGGEAKEAIVQGDVEVNGEVETRRGRTLVLGDVVRIGGVSVTVASAGDIEDDDDFFDEATADDDFDPEKWRNL